MRRDDRSERRLVATPIASVVIVDLHTLWSGDASRQWRLAGHIPMIVRHSAF
jgi:hypothetical protein